MTFAVVLCNFTIIYSAVSCGNKNKKQSSMIFQEKFSTKNINQLEDSSKKVHIIMEATKSAPSVTVPNVEKQIPQKLIEDCIDILKKSDMVYATYVGRAGMLTKETWAFNIILRTKERIEIFKTLLGSESNASKSYALCGLYLASKEEFDSAKTKYLENVFEITVYIGCVGNYINNQEFLTVVELEYLPKVMVLEKVDLKYNKNTND